ncbi:ATP-binding protein [Rheinheimera texasensis]|uniref:ATP-binding protein n=1 Tax=Rheinheimera texasensis TaxID=306205 RepID=UPI00068E1D25|nr:ATP-binding protein [Rheinheimera texasensis]
MRAGVFSLARLQSALLVLLILLFGAVAEYLALQEQRRTDAQQVRDTVESAAQLRALLEMELNAPLQLSQGLVAHVQALEGNTSAQDFQMLLPNLVRQGKHIRNMGVAPGNRLTYLYPLAGNEAAVGLYYPDLTGQWPDIELTIRSRKAKLSGPLQLAQGGRGFVYRIPVYLTDGKYWGIVSTVLNVDDIWRLLKQKAQALQVGVAVRHLNGGQGGEILLGELQQFQPPAALLALNVAGSDWQLAVWSLQPAVSLAVWFRLVGWCTALLLVLLLASVFRANRRWQQTSLAFEQSEQYYRTVLDNVADAIVVLNPAGQIHTFNHAAEQMFGYQARQLRGLPFQILFPQPPALEPGQGPQELTAQRLHGETLQVELLHTRIELQDQSLQVLLFRDITARKRMDRLKSEFISTVSHELRTPLTAINGALTLVTAGAVGSLLPAQQQMLDIARSNADQLMRLVSDILDMEKLQAGKLSLQLELQPVLPLLQQAVQRHSALALSCQVQLQLSAAIPPDLQLTLDGGRLLQVLGNLLSNAIRFSPAQSTVELRAVLSGDMLQLMVSDQGPGVPPDFVPHLFDKFSQADSSDSRQQSGSGLGLAICKELLERMGGQIYYQQAAQGGACFYCEIPLQGVAATQQERM